MSDVAKPVVRFAPSPTGRLHVGNVRTALLNWLLARKHGGSFILRFDDTDQIRSEERYVEAAREDLGWLGLTWAREERQSNRMARYQEIAASLKAAGRLYPCYETEEELDRRRKRQLARGLPPIYDRAALRLSEQERASLEAEGRAPHWRFRLSNTEGDDRLDPLPTLVSWVDLIRGDQLIDIGSVSDPVLIRADGTFLYTFTSVVDDIDLGITHVVRGEDHVTNSGVQIALFSALGAEAPAFAHHSLLVDKDGSALSKRIGSLSIAALRDEGLEAMAVASLAALVGTSDAIEAHNSLDSLAELFDLEKISRAPARFDIDELRNLNARLLHGTDYAAVAGRLESLGISGGAVFWQAVRGNIAKFSDVAEWWGIVSGEIAPVLEDQALCATAAGLLPPEPWDETTWGAWTKAVGAATGSKGRALFHPLRLALTGRDNGPELKVLLPMIGRDRALARLQGRTA